MHATPRAGHPSATYQRHVGVADAWISSDRIDCDDMRIAPKLVLFMALCTSVCCERHDACTIEVSPFSISQFFISSQCDCHRVTMIDDRLETFARQPECTGTHSISVLSVLSASIWELSCSAYLFPTVNIVTETNSSSLEVWLNDDIVSSLPNPKYYVWVCVSRDFVYFWFRYRAVMKQPRNGANSHYF